jgi:molecular chaperone DnaK
MLLLQDIDLDGLATVYGAFIAAVQAAAPDARLAELGQALTAEYERHEG